MTSKEPPTLSDDNAQASTSTSTSASSSSSLPSSTADWTKNPHISFNRTTSRWLYEDPSSGKEYEFDEGTRAWREVLDDEEVGRQQDAYGESDDEDAQQALRRKRDDVKKRKRGGHDGEQDSNKPARANASLFISNLPLDATVDEVAEVFSRYGIIAEDDDGNPRIKMYHVDDMFKGEALLSFFKPESCALAIQLLDGTCLREALGQREPLMSVEMADWSRRGSGGADRGGDTSTQQSQEQQQQEPTAKKTRTEAEKKRAAKRFAKMNDKLTGWDSDSETETTNSIRQSIADPNSTPGGPTLIPPTHAAFSTSSSRTILLKHLFTPSEITANPELLLEIKDDIREECMQFGTVTNVVLYDLEEDGLVMVRFAKSAGEEAAKSAARKMHGRWFDGRAVGAFLVQGRVRYRRSGKGGEEEEGEDKDDAFGEWLERGRTDQQE